MQPVNNDIDKLQSQRANSMLDVDYKQVGARDRLIAEQNVGARPSELLVN